MPRRLQRFLVANGALVYLVGLVAGLPFAFMLLEKISLWPIPGEVAVHLPGDVRAWRMAHLEGILNGLTCFAVAAVGPYLRLSPRGYGVLVWSLVVTAWGNVIASFLGPLTGGRGLEFGHGGGNSLMYLLFTTAVFAVIVAMLLVHRGASAADDTPRAG